MTIMWGAMKAINNLINYGIKHKFITKRDAVYAYNQVMYLLNLDLGEGIEFYDVDMHIDDILNDITPKDLDPIMKEHFKSKVMDTIMDRPSIYEYKFNHLYKLDPIKATNYYYDLSKKTNYIKEKQIAKNILFDYEGEYGKLNITINLSKPEKSPKDIKRLKEAKSLNWPSCLLCQEHEGLYGTMTSPDRANHRMINLNLNQKDWFLQYSPYSYYNEHAIVLSPSHTDMKIDRDTFENLIDFVDQFKHYMIGSNADLPIVGGSMLTHDHYQAGRHDFPIFNAKSNHHIPGDVAIDLLNWPLSTIKLTSSYKEMVIQKADTILQNWINYDNQELDITSKTDVRHNTITPICRFNEGKFEMYLILRNNKTSELHPDGIFHPHADKHHIKKENIGLIEAIGLAVLPARLKEELELVKQAVINHEPLDDSVVKHQTIYDQLQTLDGDIDTNLNNLVGEVFERVLKDCGVFKEDLESFKAFIGE